MEDNSAYQLRRHQELREIQQRGLMAGDAGGVGGAGGGMMHNGGRFASPGQEWEWRREQAEKNRIRAGYDLGRSGGGGGGGERGNRYAEARDFKARMNDMNGRREREEMERKEQMEQMRRQDEARAVFFQNRQIAAAAKKRYEVEEIRSPEVGRRGRKGSSAAEVRRSAEIQRQVEEAKKKRAYDDAYKQIAMEKMQLAEKLKRREEGKEGEGVGQVEQEEEEEVVEVIEEEDIYSAVPTADNTIATNIEIGNDDEDGDEEVEGVADVEGLAQALAEVEGGLGAEDEEDDEEDDEGMIVRGGNIGELMASRGNLRGNLRGTIHTEDDIEEDIVFRGENTIPIDNLASLGNEIDEEEVAQIEELGEEAERGAKAASIASCLMLLYTIMLLCDKSTPLTRRFAPLPTLFSIVSLRSSQYEV